MARGNGGVKENGHAVATQANGYATRSKKAVEDDIYEEENIFLFIPNIIGT